MSTVYAELIPTGPSVADRLLEAGRDMARSQHRLVRLAAEFEESTEWYLFATTRAHWMAQQLEVCVATAREWIRMGKALRALPAVNEAFAAERLSFAKVPALTRLATPDTEVELVELARSVPAGRLGHALAAWTQRREDHAERMARHVRDMSPRHRVEPHGIGHAHRPAPTGGRGGGAGVGRGHHDAPPPSRRSHRTWRIPLPRVANTQTAVASDSLAQRRAEAFVERVAPHALLRAPIHDAYGRAPCHRRRHERE